jgi:hypothetical protein
MFYLQQSMLKIDSSANRRNTTAHRYAAQVRKSLQRCDSMRGRWLEIAEHLEWQHGSGEIATVRRRSRQHLNPQTELGW